MKKVEQAKIILNNLERYVAVDAAFEEFYIKAIVAGLAEIEKIKRRSCGMSKGQREVFNALVDRVLDYDNRDKLPQSIAYFFGCLNVAIEDDHEITGENLILCLNSAIEFVIDRKR